MLNMTLGIKQKILRGTCIKEKHSPKYKLKSASGKIGSFKCYHEIKELCKLEKTSKTVSTGQDQVLFF